MRPEKRDVPEEVLRIPALDRLRQETKAYLCADNSAGFIFECSPLAFAGEKTADTLEGLLRLNVPDGSVLQFILIADDHVNHYIDTYRSLKTRDDELVRKSVDRFGAFLLGGTEGLEKLNNMPVRDFRLIVAFKLPVRQWDGDLRPSRSCEAPYSRSSAAPASSPRSWSARTS